MERHSGNYFIVCLFACGLTARLTIASPVPVRSAQKDASGVTMRLESGVLRLEVCDDRTIHVICGPTDRLPEKNGFVVIRQWKPAPFEWREEGSRLILPPRRLWASKLIEPPAS